MLLNQFANNASSYSRPNALFLGEAANAAYQTASGMKDWAQQAGFTACTPFAAATTFVVSGTIEGFVASSDSTLLVSFRGTDPTVGDWTEDFRARPVSAGKVPGLVHEGFKDALQVVWDQILPLLNARGSRNLWITGHSLGGAISIACAARTHFELNIPITGVYTYGQPRYGNEEFAHAYHDALGAVTFRHVNQPDIVPRVPPFSLGFRHCGAENLFQGTTRILLKAAYVETVMDLLSSLVSQVPAGILGLLSAVQDLAQGTGEQRLMALKKNAFRVATDHVMPTAYLPFLNSEAARP